VLKLAAASTISAQTFVRFGIERRVVNCPIELRAWLPHGLMIPASSGKARRRVYDRP
jgi:hypothetical protein